MAQAQIPTDPFYLLSCIPPGIIQQKSQVTAVCPSLRQILLKLKTICPGLTGQLHILGICIKTEERSFPQLDRRSQTIHRTLSTHLGEIFLNNFLLSPLNLPGLTGGQSQCGPIQWHSLGKDLQRDVFWVVIVCRYLSATKGSGQPPGYLPDDGHDKRTSAPALPVGHGTPHPVQVPCPSHCRRLHRVPQEQLSFPSREPQQWTEVFPDPVATG